MKRTYTTRRSSNYHSKNNPESSFKPHKKQKRGLRREKKEDCNPYEESKKQILNEVYQEISQEDEKSVNNKYHPNQSNTPFMDVCNVSMSYGQQFITPEPTWSLDEILILSLALYKTGGDLGYLQRMFPGREIYRHVITSLGRLAYRIRYNGYVEQISSQIQKVELTIYVAMLLNGIEETSPIQEVVKIVQDLQLEDKECFGFLEKIHTGIKFSEEIFHEFLESMMENIENKMHELASNTGNIQDCMNLRGRGEGTVFVNQNIQELQYYQIPYIDPYGILPFCYSFPMPFAPIHL